MTLDDIPIREPDEIRQACVRKLRLVKISDHFQAILGCMLVEDWTTRRLLEMVITGWSIASSINSVWEAAFVC